METLQVVKIDKNCKYVVIIPRDQPYEVAQQIHKRLNEFWKNDEKFIVLSDALQLVALEKE